MANRATISLGEIRELTKDLPDETLVTAYDPQRGWYVNLDLTQEAKDFFLKDENPSLVMDVLDDVDTRQW
jgi:hypothetical protein